MKVEQNCLDQTIVYHHAMSFQKNFNRADHENKVAPFFSKIVPSPKKDFFGKLANMTNVYHTTS